MKFEFHHIVYITTAVVCLLSIIVVTIIHSRLFNKEEILRLRPERFYLSASISTSLFFVFIITEQFLQYPAFDLFYEMLLFVVVTFFFLFYIECVFFFMHKNRKENTKKDFLTLVMITYQSKVKLCLVGVFTLFIFLNIGKKVYFFYYQIVIINPLMLLEFLIFLFFYIAQSILVSRQKEDPVGLKRQIVFLGIGVVILPIVIIVKEVIDRYTDGSVRFKIAQQVLSYWIIALVHIIGFCQILLPLIVLMLDLRSLETQESQKTRTLDFDELIKDKLFLEFFGSYLKSEYSYLHLVFYQDAIDLLELVEEKEKNNDVSEECILNIIDTAVDHYDKYVNKDCGEYNKNNLAAMFENEAQDVEYINIDKSLEIRLKALRNKLDNPSIFQLFNHQIQADYCNDIKKIFGEAVETVHNMLRNSYRRFKKSDEYKSYQSQLQVNKVV